MKLGIGRNFSVDETLRGDPHAGRLILAFGGGKLPARDDSQEFLNL